MIWYVFVGTRARRVKFSGVKADEKILICITEINYMKYIFNGSVCTVCVQILGLDAYCDIIATCIQSQNGCFLVPKME